ncbi:ATP-binding cassette, subfamily B [Zobellia uliginosa]|uniref:ATP-binding cassette, subfamily B n=1 Tax=Zobellia uliginosa TaxID=143224 RepID=A0ABY1KPC2_9FLAO|nr:peptidase domain-containing ABC transporter [Zobellia uliginosa]SIS47969.1 ATP-binding cassette, subfamily B [Zobellia uliginosa]
MIGYKNRIKLVRQHDLMDCGPASLSMVTYFYGNKFPLHYLRELCQIGKDGVSMSGIIHAAKKIGMETYSTRLNLDLLVKKFTKPCILYWNKNHFLVLESISNKGGNVNFHIADPAHGKVVLSEKDFKEPWLKGGQSGVALFLSPTHDFFLKKNNSNVKNHFKTIVNFLKPYKKKILVLSFLILLGSAFSVTLPFLTEALIDYGVTPKNLNYISLILLAQLFVFIGIMTINILRNWFTLIIGTKLSVDIVYSYLDKVLKLPLSFFDTKNSGDFNQRIQDNIKVERFLTSDSILTVFSALLLLVYSGILFHYGTSLFLTYIGLTLVSVYWSYYWLKKREVIDYKIFLARSENQEAIYEFYNGIREMKLNQYESYKKNQWVELQNNLLQANIKSLKIEQFQSIGFTFFNQLKNILVTFLAANYVVKDIMTLGALLSVSYIIGQMNSPVHQLLSFFRSQQDAFLSFNRLSEVYTQENEEKESDKKLDPEKTPVDIKIQNVNFKYNVLSHKYILQDIDLTIPRGKITAIVGHSGSGKTTLMKLLLKFFPPLSGKIFYGLDEINGLSSQSIRENSGIVMQDGYIFNDTIERNIALKDKIVDKEKLEKALGAVNLLGFVNSLALKEHTKIGSGGNDLSGGQKQRILIARAIYKNPKYIFLDEATSALDATNEKEVHNNLQKLFKDKTVVIIAHRLSTVQNADQIIVLSEGKMVEQGTHTELIDKKEFYYTLVKDQLNI